MFLPQILLLSLLALLFRLMTAGTARRWLVFAASVLCVYWLQPATPVRYLDFWLPTATLALTGLGWVLTAPDEQRRERANWLTAGALAGLVLVAALTRHIGDGAWLTPTRPPATLQVIAALVGAGALLVGLGWLVRRFPGTPGKLLAAAIVALIALLLWLKTPALALEAGRAFRGLMGQNMALATAFDVRWLGFSYVCFRLIHTLRDRQLGRLPAVDLLTYVTYVVFFPAFVAGPIDRVERFQKDFCPKPAKPKAVEEGRTSPAPVTALGIVARPAVPFSLSIDSKFVDDLTEAGRRLAIGLLMKFAIADSLALIALSPVNALQVRQTGWLWVMVYLYALQIYFDFAGYTHIAIGLGRLLGVKLPENFAAPYLKPNLTQFWNSWHMSLTQWFRAYFFNPFVRWLRSGKPISPSVMLLLTQVSTMLLIGLWHGVTVNFVLWGLWHGLGLFVQNRWTEIVRPLFAARSVSPAGQRALDAFSTLLTFHWVALGWVWFALPTVEMAGAVFAHLFGMGW